MKIRYFALLAKTIILILASGAWPNSLMAQEFRDFYDKEDKLTFDFEKAAYYSRSADTMLIVNGTERLHTRVEKFYLNGEKSEFYIKTQDRKPISVGPYIKWHENGQVALSGQFDKGKRSGIWKALGSDGQLQWEKEYIPNNRTGEPDQLRIITLYDSIGQLKVSNGKGWYSEVNDLEGINRGPVEDGWKEGEWRGYKKDSSLWFVEVYKKGQLIEGRSFHEGEEYHYNTISEPASPKEGMQAFYAEVKRVLESTETATNSCGRMGGKIYLEYTVNPDGTMDDFVIKKGLTSDCNRDILITFSKLDVKWNPAMLRGRRTSQKMIIPLSF